LQEWQLALRGCSYLLSTSTAKERCTASGTRAVAVTPFVHLHSVAKAAYLDPRLPKAAV
jgi:hypothetical protein